MFDKPFFTYLGMGIAVAAMVLGVIEPDWANIAWTVAAVFGFGSVASLRTMIDSKGWKTYAIAVFMIVASLLQVAKVITPETFQALVVVFAPLTGLTVQQSLAKSTSSVPKVGAK